MSSAAILSAVLTLLVLPAVSRADEPVKLTLKDHRFTPDLVTVPAGQRFRIEVTNADAEPAEFESTALHAEKIVVPGSTIGVMAGPLHPGKVTFFDDYHPDTARGTVVATEK